MTAAVRAMPELIRITDPTDERLADYAALTDAALRKRYEHQHGVLIAEGPNPVRALITSAYPTRSLLIAHEQVAAMMPAMADLDAPVFVVTRDLLYEVVRFKLHQGVIGCGQRLPPGDPVEVVRSARLVAVLEGLNDHENLGVLFRAARALGVHGVLLSPGCADPLYRRSIRVSMGHVLHVPHARLDELPDAFSILGDAGFTTVAMTPDPTAPDIRNLEMGHTERVAVLLGAEGSGLTESAVSGADGRARIAMHDGVDSLNVAVAAAIAFHALARSA